MVNIDNVVFEAAGIIVVVFVGTVNIFDSSLAVEDANVINVVFFMGELTLLFLGLGL